jgi:hypothetical protein
MLGLKDGSKNVLLALIYAWIFEGVRLGQGIPAGLEDPDAATEPLDGAAEVLSPLSPRDTSWF